MKTVSEEWIRRIPKVELHLHLEGSIRSDVLRRLGKRNGIDLPLFHAGMADPAYQYAGFLEFLGCFKTACSVLATPEDLAHVAENLLDELIGQQVVYAEIFLSPVIHERRGIDTEATMRLIDAVAKE